MQEIDGLLWPDVFVYPDRPYLPEETDPERRKKAAICDGLMGWANCMCGNRPPAGFGLGMVMISDIIGELATSGNLERLAEEVSATPYQPRTRE